MDRPFKIILSAVPEGDQTLILAKLAEMFNIEPDVARNIVQSVPIIILDDLLFGTALAVRERLESLVQRGATLVTTDDACDEIPKVRWPSTPEIARVDILTELPPGATSHMSSPAPGRLSCPSCGAHFRLERVDSGRFQPPYPAQPVPREVPRPAATPQQPPAPRTTAPAPTADARHLAPPPRPIPEPPPVATPVSSPPAQAEPAPALFDPLLALRQASRRTNPARPVPAVSGAPPVHHAPSSQAPIQPPTQAPVPVVSPVEPAPSQVQGVPLPRSGPNPLQHEETEAFGREQLDGLVGGGPEKKSNDLDDFSDLDDLESLENLEGNASHFDLEDALNILDDAGVSPVGQAGRTGFQPAGALPPGRPHAAPRKGADLLPLDPDEALEILQTAKPSTPGTPFGSAGGSEGEHGVAPSAGSESELMPLDPKEAMAILGMQAPKKRKSHKPKVTAGAETALEKPAAKPERRRAPSSDNGSVHGLFLTRIQSVAKRKKAAELIAQIRGISVDEAMRMTDRTIIPVLQGVTREEAERHQRKFKDLQISARVTTKRGHE